MDGVIFRYKVLEIRFLPTAQNGFAIPHFGESFVKGRLCKVRNRLKPRGFVETAIFHHIKMSSKRNFQNNQQNAAHTHSNPVQRDADAIRVRTGLRSDDSVDPYTAPETRVVSRYRIRSTCMSPVIHRYPYLDCINSVLQLTHNPWKPHYYSNDLYSDTGRFKAAVSSINREVASWVDSSAGDGRLLQYRTALPRMP